MKLYLIALLFVLCTSFGAAQVPSPAAGGGLHVHSSPAAHIVLSGCSGSTCG